jgi:hypothetical protein
MAYHVLAVDEVGRDLHGAAEKNGQLRAVRERIALQNTRRHAGTSVQATPTSQHALGSLARDALDHVSRPPHAEPTTTCAAQGSAAQRTVIVAWVPPACVSQVGSMAETVGTGCAEGCTVGAGTGAAEGQA